MGIRAKPDDAIQPRSRLPTLNRAGTTPRSTICPFANQPTTTGSAVTTTSGTGYRQWAVAGLVQAMYSSGSNNGFLIRDATEGQDAEQQLHAREKGDNPPQLVLAFKPAP